MGEMLADYNGEIVADLNGEIVADFNEENLIVVAFHGEIADIMWKQ